MVPQVRSKHRGSIGFVSSGLGPKYDPARDDKQPGRSGRAAASLYESTISALSALATSGAAALKTSRANARALGIRTALTKTLLASGPSVTSIVLDKDNRDPALSDIAVLCTPRQNYVSNAVSLNYLNTLVQNINAVSAKAAAPNDITGAIKLLLATSNYAIADKVKVPRDW